MKEGKGAHSLVAMVMALGSIVFATFEVRAEPPLSQEFSDRYEIYSAPKQPPETSFADAEGRDLTLSSFPGEVVVVNFWATWCAPCIEEMPTLLRLHERLRESGEGRVVAISLDRGGLETVEPFYEDLGLADLPIYLDPGSEIFQALGGKVMPTTYILDPEGRLVGEMIGPAEWDAAPALTLIRHYAGDGG